MRYPILFLIAALTFFFGRACVRSLRPTPTVQPARAEEEPHRHRWCDVGSAEMRSCCVYRERVGEEMRCTKKGLASCQPKICASCPATSESCTGCMATD